MTALIKFSHYPTAEKEAGGPGNKEDNPTNIDNSVTNDDEAIINSDTADAGPVKPEEPAAGIDKKDLVEVDAAPDEEDMDEADNNYRDALNNDSLEAPEKKN